MAASFSVEKFVGNGSLKELVPKFLDGGWADVPMLKIMNSRDMDAMNMTQQQKDALRLRSYLHDRKLMQFADRLEAAGKPLSELIRLSPVDLVEFDMRRAHIERFTDSTTPYQVPAINVRGNSTPKRASASESSHDNTRQNLRGIIAAEAEPAESRLCCCIQPQPLVDDVAPYSAIKNISVEILSQDYKIGKEQLVKTKALRMKASELWLDKPVVLFCIRRPGCVMCRAHAHRFYSKKPIFDALGFQLVAVLHEYIETEVEDFWPHYWGGVTVLDLNMDFFKALGGGKLLKENFITGFVFNPRAIANYRHAKDSGFENNFKGEGRIKGGVFIVRSGNGGIAYQFIERNFGDWAPIEEVIDICTRLQVPQLLQSYDAAAPNDS